MALEAIRQPKSAIRAEAPESGWSSGLHPPLDERLEPPSKGGRMCPHARRPFPAEAASGHGDGNAGGEACPRASDWEGPFTPDHPSTADIGL